MKSLKIALLVYFIVLLHFSSTAQGIPTNGLVAYYPFDGSATDESGVGDNGTLVGNAQYGPGIKGQGIVLDGNGSGVQLANPTNLWLQNLSIVSWVKRASSTVISYGSGGVGTIWGGYTGSYYLLMDDWANDGGDVGFGELGASALQGPRIADTSWHQVVMTKAGSTVTFYLDGAVVSTQSYNVTFAFTGNFSIGYRPDNGDNGFYGTLDEVRVYNRLLSASEIQGLYLADSGVPPTSVPVTITNQPVSQTVALGTSVSFGVSAGGTPPLTYQWSFDGTNIPGATNSNFTINAAQFTNAGEYAVLVSNPVDSVLSSNADLTVNASYPTNGLVAYYPFDGSATDESGVGDNGTLVGNARYGPGIKGQGIVLDGNGSGVLLGNPTNLWLQNLSIVSWVKRASSSVISYGSGGVGTIWGGFTGSYYLLMDNWASDGGDVGFGELDLSDLAGPRIADTNWHQVVVAKAGSTVIFYLDGAVVSTQSYNATFTFTGNFSIGYRPDNGDNSFYGTLDEVRVYNWPLSASEIQGIYLADSSGNPTPEPVTIANEPVSQTVALGTSVSFSVSAGGTPPFTYQWSFGGANIPGATNATLTVNDAQFTNAGVYAVVVSNPVDSVLSSNAVLSVNPAYLTNGLVAYYPLDGNAMDASGIGDNGTLVGNAQYGPGIKGQGIVLDGNGSGVLLGNPTNLWLQNLSIVSWVKRASSSVISYGSGGVGTIWGGFTGSYYLLMDNWASDGGDVGFGELDLSDLAGPRIADTNWHQVVVAKAGSTVIFYLDGAVVSTQSYNATFTFTGNFSIGYRPDNGDNSFYGSLDEVRVYNRPLAASEVQGLYVADVPAPAPVTITNQPVSQTVALGQSVSFTVLAGGTPPLTYIWLFNGTNFPNSATATLTFAEAAPANSGAYSVIISNDFGSVTSSIANLNLTPYLQTPFPGALTYWGQTNTFSVVAGGSGDLFYQWYFDGVAVKGATNAMLLIPGIQFTNAGLYSVVVSSSYGSVTNTPEQVVVNPAGTALKFFANVMLTGTVGYTYTIQSSTDLSNPNAWITETNLTLTEPVEYWDDTSVDVHASQQKFYRILPGQ